LRRMFLALAAMLFLLAPAMEATTADYRVIVNPEVKGSQIPRATLSSIFLRKAAHWGDGTSVQPVDQSIRARVRMSFTADILGQDMVSVQMYWQRRIASGVTPPPVKPSDEEIVAFVAANAGAIGYVSADTPLPASVKEVQVIN
jgi:ABC-type phosphate transport system substrate-binding protein